METIINPSSRIIFKNAQLFAEYAHSFENKWNDLIGWPITHSSLGKCKLVQTDMVQGELRLLFSFEDDPKGKLKKFTKESFIKGQFILDNLPSSILEGVEKVKAELEEQIRADELHNIEVERQKKEREENQRKQEIEKLARIEEERLQKEREAESQKHFIYLKTKYGLESINDTAPTSELYKVLLQWENGDPTSEEDISWLKHHQMNAALAVYYDLEFKAYNDGWDLIKAGTYWRNAHFPDKVLEITEFIRFGDNKTQAALFTNRGGAYRDKGDLDNAEQCANNAIDLQPKSYYPYNLLGAVYYQRGNPNAGDEYFKKAIELGAKPKDQDEMIEKTIKVSEAATRRLVAKYLIEKDPIRYKWAEYYLK
jgi:tetratricopeptide (TPR) repeat protein